MPERAGIMQWNEAPIISGMNIGPGIQQNLDSFTPSIA
jgi:hypothetical protein